MRRAPRYTAVPLSRAACVLRYRCYRFAFYREAQRNLKWGKGDRQKLPPLIEHLAKTHWQSVDGQYTGYRPDPTVTVPERSPKRPRRGAKVEETDSQAH